MLRTVEKHSGVPAYVQIMNMVKKEVFVGNFAEKAQLPPVRELALIFDVNINTVLKALEKLSNEGVVRSEQGVGYFIQVSHELHRETIPLLRETVTRMKSQGIDLEMTKLLIDELWRTEKPE
jgi:DNA-binding transcriptional regulator YhcF (GntR family)